MQGSARSLIGWIRGTLGLALVAGGVAMAGPAAGEQMEVSIGALRVLNTTPDFVELEVSGVQADGLLGQVCLGVIAKSKDGIVRSSGFLPVIAPNERQFRAVARVLRPAAGAAQATDFLLVMAYRCNGHDDVLRRTYTWAHVWPQKPASPEAEANPAGAGQAYVAFSASLEEEDFAALDALMVKWNDPRERDENGEWKLNSFRSVFVSYSAERRDWKGDLARLQKWRAYNPKSAGAAIAEAKYWVAYAWHIRGNEQSQEVDPVALKVFGERMQRAEQILQAAKPYAADNPLWYEAYLDLAVATKREESFVSQLYEEATHRHPSFQPLYLDMAKYRASRWSQQADWKKADEIIQRATAVTATTDGQGNYAMLYMQLGELQPCECNLFGESNLSWVKMRDAFDDLVQRYPSVGNLNQYAAFACRAGDKGAFLKIRPRIQGRILPNKWLTGYSYDLCDHRFMQSA